FIFLHNCSFPIYYFVIFNDNKIEGKYLLKLLEFIIYFKRKRKGVDHLLCVCYNVSGYKNEKMQEEMVIWEN
ncbi:hypothetical protein B1P96_09560, partial [Enterococcus faecium]|uniref:hypothetical protein n=3 Tax=Enterococcus faecium TaxID=1352 RepID=UPI00098BECE3